jgi:tetratricopeptide (TPR) repeat protein
MDMDMDSRYENGCREMELHNYESAEKIFKEILTDESKHYAEAAANKLGVIYAKNGQSVEGEKYFKLALSSCNSYAPALVNLGNLSLERGDIEVASAFYKNAIENDENYFLAYYNLAILFKKVGNYREYIRNYKIYKKLYKRHINRKVKGGDLYAT